MSPLLWCLVALAPFIVLSEQHPTNHASQTHVLKASGETHKTYIPSRFAPSTNKRGTTQPLNCTVRSQLDITWDPSVTIPKQVRDPVSLATKIWSCILGSTIPIRVFIGWAPLGSGWTLAHTSTSSWKARTGPLSRAWYPKPLYNKLLGADIDPTSYDCSLTLNSDWDSKFYYGLDGATPDDFLDLTTIVLHEMCHCFAFTGFAWVNDTMSEAYFLYNGYPAQFDRFIVDKFPKGDLVYRNYQDGSADLLKVYQGNNLGWQGVVARLYAPEEYSDGSSIYHFDEELYPPGNPNSLMTPQLGFAEAVHDPGPLCESVMVSMGWTTTPV